MKLRLSFSSIFLFSRNTKMMRNRNWFAEFQLFHEIKRERKNFVSPCFAKLKFSRFQKQKNFPQKNNFVHFSFAHKTCYVTFCKKCLSFHNALFIYFSFRMWNGIFRKIWKSRNKLDFFLSTTKLVFHENLENCEIKKNLSENPTWKPLRYNNSAHFVFHEIQ